MSALQAFYFDGKSTDGRPVALELDTPQVLHVRGSGIDLTWPLAEVRASERIGASRRRLYFPDGAQCETADNNAVDRMFAAQESPAVDCRSTVLPLCVFHDRVSRCDWQAAD